MARDVDAIWMQLKASCSPVPSASSSAPSAERQPRAHAEACSLEQPKPHPPIATEEELRESASRPSNLLVDGDRSSQRHAALELNRIVQAADPKLLSYHVASELLWSPLSRALTCPFERTRELSTSALTAASRAVPEAASCCLSYVLPALQSRLLRRDGASSPPEPSEELRASFYSLLRSLLFASGKLCAPHASEIVELLEEAHHDAFPSVPFEACATAKTLADSLGRRLQTVGRQLVRLHAPSLGHRRARVRAAAVDAVCRVAHCGGHDAILDLVGFHHPNVVPTKAFFESDQRINFFGKLSSDPSAKVRERFAAALEDWMQSLPERREHESRLVPFALAALADSSPDVSYRAFAALDALGREREESERPEELRNRLQNDPQRSMPPLELTPFTSSRPRLGARVAVQDNLGALVPAALSELKSWQLEKRLSSAKLLHVALSLAEESATQHLPWLVPTLASAAESSEKDLRVNTLRCLAVVSSSAPPSQWIGTIEEMIDSGGEAEQRQALNAAAEMATHCRRGSDLTTLANLVHGRPHLVENPSLQHCVLDVLQGVAFAICDEYISITGQEEKIQGLAWSCVLASVSAPYSEEKSTKCREALRSAASLIDDGSVMRILDNICSSFATQLLSRLRAGDFTRTDAERAAHIPALVRTCNGLLTARNVESLVCLAVESHAQDEYEDVIALLLDAASGGLKLASCDKMDLTVYGFEKFLLRHIELHAARSALENALELHAIDPDAIVQMLVASEHEGHKVINYISQESDGEVRHQATELFLKAAKHAEDAITRRLQRYGGADNLPLSNAIQSLEDDARADVREAAAQLSRALLRNS